MSKEKDNLDQLFSDAAQSEKAPQYDTAYWAEMKAILNARDAKKRTFLFWAFGGAATFASLLIILFTLNMNNYSGEELYVKEDINLSNDDASDERNETTMLIQEGSSANNSEFNNESVLKRNSQQGDLTFINDQLEPNQELFTSNNQNYEKKSSRINIVNPINHEQTLNSKLKALSSEVKEEYKKKKNTDVKTAKDIDIRLPYKPTHLLEEKDIKSISKSTLEYKQKPQYILYAKFSGGLMENYKTSRPYESRLFNLSLNLEANLNNVLFHIGLGTQLTSNADLILTQRAKVYGFGVVTHQNDLSYQNLVDIYIPFEIGYQLNTTSFGIGAQVNYLVTTKLDLNHYENNVLIKTDQYFGNTNGLNEFSTQGYVWLEQRLAARFALGLKVGTNISGRINDNTYFNQSATTNPIYGQLSLRFNFTK